MVGTSRPYPPRQPRAIPGAARDLHRSDTLMSSPTSPQTATCLGGKIMSPLNRPSPSPPSPEPWPARAYPGQRASALVGAADRDRSSASALAESLPGSARYINTWSPPGYGAL